MEKGDTVTKGETLLHFDKKIIEEKAKSIYIPIVITNTNDMQEIRKNYVQQVTAGENDILFVKK